MKGKSCIGREVVGWVIVYSEGREDRGKMLEMCCYFPYNFFEYQS